MSFAADRCVSCAAERCVSCAVREVCELCRGSGIGPAVTPPGTLSTKERHVRAYSCYVMHHRLISIVPFNGNTSRCVLLFYFYDFRICILSVHNLTSNFNALLLG